MTQDTFATRIKQNADEMGITMNTLSIMLMGQADELDRYSGAVAHLSTQKQIAQRARDAAKLREIAARYARRDCGD